MAYNVVSLVLDLADGTGALIGHGSCKLAPSAQLTDASDNLLVIESPVWADLSPVTSPKIPLLATDNANLLPSGWAWTISFPGVPGNPSGYNFFLPAAPQTFTATNASPCVFTGSGSGYLNNTGVQLSGLSLPAGFSAGTVYWTVNASGSTFELAATAGGTPIASTSAGSGSVIAVSSYLSSLSPVSSVTTMAAYMPLPSGTPSAGQVPVATGSGEASAWGSGSPMTTLGDLLYENSTPAPARLAGNTTGTKNFLTSTGSGGNATAPAWGTIASGDIPIDSTAGDIKPVSTAAAAGASGKIPDASHVHLGFFGGLFGTGSDGPVTLDGSTPFAATFGTPAGNVYTQVRDVWCTNLTINNGVTLDTGNFRIFCQGTLTSNGTITRAGARTAGSSASFVTLRGGGAAGSGVSGTGGSGGTGTFGGSGGNGGAGTSGAAGSGGTSGVSAANAENNVFQTPFAMLAGGGVYAFAGVDMVGGSGGGGGGSDSSSNAGAGGGQGGGVVGIMAWAVVNNGTITVAGAAGGNAAAGNAGGGGGGGGGIILVYTLSAWTAGTLTVAGGNAGNGHGSGSNGSAGSSGFSLNIVLA